MDYKQLYEQEKQRADKLEHQKQQLEKYLREEYKSLKKSAEGWKHNEIEYRLWNAGASEVFFALKKMQDLEQEDTE